MDELSIFTRLEKLIASSSNPTHQLRDPNTPISTILADLGTPSASIAVLDHGTISTHMISTDSSHDVDTLFQACSVSKACAGFMVARLMDQGYFKPDSYACDLLPESVVQRMTRDPRTAKLMRRVQIRHLMSHTAGLSVHGFPGYPVESHAWESLPDSKAILTGRDGVNTAEVKIIAPPGLGFMYSGGGIEVLQVVVEHVVGRSFQELMNELVFEPLGMKRSFYRLTSDEKNLARAYYTGVTQCDSLWHHQPELAAAGLWTTSGDLLRLVRGLQTCLEGEEKEALMSREIAEMVLTNVKPGIGLTWFCNEYSIGHSGGNMPGYRCFMLGYADLPWNKKPKPKRDEEKGELNTGNDEVSMVKKLDIPGGCGIAVMTNAATGYEVALKLTTALAYLKGWPEPPSYMATVEPGVPLTVHESVKGLESDEWKEYIGTWTDKQKDYVWKLESDVDSKPVALTGADADANANDTDAYLSLRAATITPVEWLNGKKSIDLVVDGTEIMLRLGWAREGGEDVKVVRIWHHKMQFEVVLYSTLLSR